MDLKDRLDGLKGSLELKRMDQRLIIAMAILGLMLIAFTIWLYLSDSTTRQDKAKVDADVQQALDQLSQPIQALNRVMFDAQVQALAVRAIENPATLDDLLSYLKGRIPEITGTKVFGPDVDAIDGSELGANGFALLDALLTLQQNRFPQLQIHHSIEPAVMVDAIKIYNGTELAGYLVVELDPDFVLFGFNPAYLQPRIYRSLPIQQTPAGVTCCSNWVIGPWPGKCQTECLFPVPCFGLNTQCSRKLSFSAIACWF